MSRTKPRSFSEYVTIRLEKMLAERRIVVFYDPREEFASFIDSLHSREGEPEDLPVVTVGDSEVRLGRYEGSLFALKLRVEPNAALDEPQPMLVYVPGRGRDRQRSILMELEKAGEPYEPNLRQLARNCLRNWLTDADIDEMLAPEGITYEDVVQFVTQAAQGAGPSVVKLVLGEGSSELLLARWLAETEHDAQLEAKQGQKDLYKLVGQRVGFDVPSGTPLDKARRQVARFVLVNEFRSDLACDDPSELAVVPKPAGKEQRERAIEVAHLVRRNFPEANVGLADTVEQELSLGELPIAAGDLGSIDTFRFEEKALLRRAGALAEAGDFEGALKVVCGRGRSFWLDRDFGRQAQWRACDRIAELGARVRSVVESVDHTVGDPATWVKRYSESDGWHLADRAHREMESWLARMDDEPEEVLEKALAGVRTAYEDMLSTMSKRFVGALVDAEWAVPDTLHQSEVFSKVVESAGGRTAYFLVDALRYEMAPELATQLGEVEELRLRPAMAALPSITTVGMGALMPRASSGFSVVDDQGSLAVEIDDSRLCSSRDRMRFMRARRPEAVDMDLGEVLHKGPKALERRITESSLVVVRSQSIDGLGELDSGLIARQVMDTLVGNIARAIHKLAGLGIENIVVSADHGYLFSSRRGEDMMMEKPGGETVELHRRCWIGRGGQTPPGSVRVTGSELGYRTDLDFIFPEGVAVFKSGGDLSFHHGGLSLQEAVIPVISARIPAGKDETSSRQSVVLEGLPETLTNRTFGITVSVQGDLFTQDFVPVKVLLVAGGEEVGRAGLAVGAECDASTGIVMVPPNQNVSVGLMLSSDKAETVRIVAQDPSTDSILAQSPDIPVRLGI